MVRSQEASDTAISYLWSEKGGDGDPLKTATAAALLLHALVFAIRLPEIRFDGIAEDKPKLFLITPTKLRPPVDLPREPPQPRDRRVPIPDPTPEAIEPLFSSHVMAPVVEFPIDFSVAEIPDPPSPVSTGPILFRSEMKRPIRISGLDPTYTEAARRARIEGAVILQAVIDKTGAIRNIEILKAQPFGLDIAAVQAVETWRFSPARLDDRPIDVIYSLTIRFGLQ